MAFASTTTVWYQWTAGTAATSNSVTDPWAYWISISNSTTGGAAWSTVADVNPSAEELERRRVQLERIQKERAAAELRARELLVSTLDRKQYREFEREGYFHVHTKDGVRAYRIRPGSPPLRVKGEDGLRWQYCIHPEFGYPSADVALAHKLLLESDEEEFLRIANASPLVA